MTEFLEINKPRFLLLTEDDSLIETQLKGQELDPNLRYPLRNKISTDAFPTSACFRFDSEHLAHHALSGLNLNKGRFPKGGLSAGKFGILVAGSQFGGGSAREHFPMSLKEAGIELILAESIAAICAQNLQNIGLPYLEGDPYQLLEQLIQEGKIPYHHLTANLDQISSNIVTSGGLFPYLKRSSEYPTPQTSSRPMTGPEKIIAKHMDVDYVQPGDLGMMRVDRRYTYEIFASWVFDLFLKNSPDQKLVDSESIYLFYDHSVYSHSPDSRQLSQKMRQIASQFGIKLYDGETLKGSEGVCHPLMIKRGNVLPGETVIATDSHTPYLGSLGTYSVGVGATEFAAALWKGVYRTKVPSSVMIELTGQPSKLIMAKDIILFLLSQPYFKNGLVRDKIMEFTGSTFNHLEFDQQTIFTNMSAEAGARTGFLGPNPKSTKVLEQALLTAGIQPNIQWETSDPDAEYDQKFSFDVDRIEPYIALPGDPRNGVPLSSLLAKPGFNRRLDHIFVGSCAGGDVTDLYHLANILEGEKVDSKVKLYVQPSSKEAYDYADKMGWLRIIETSGGEVLGPGCGACVNFGPGSVDIGQRVLTTAPRNFPGRMGRGDAFLVNVKVAAQSAIEGQITTP